MKLYLPLHSDIIIYIISAKQETQMLYNYGHNIHYLSIERWKVSQIFREWVSEWA